MESRSKKVGRNIVFATIYQILKLFLAFVIRIIFVRKLGVEYLGVNGLFSNLLTIFSLADMGITTAMMYNLYKPLSENDELKIARYISYFGKMYRIIAIIIAIVGILFIPFLHLIVNLPENMPNIYLYYILLLLNSVLSYLFVYKTTLLMADQKMYIINKYDIIFYIILFILQLGVILYTESFALYLTCNVICTFLGNVFKVKETNKLYPYIKKRECIEPLTADEKKSIFSNVKSLFYYKIGGIIQSNTDNILISIFVGTIVVGYYSNYTMIILQCTSFITLIFSALKSSVGNYLVTETSNHKYEMFNMLETFNYWLVGVSTILFFVLIPDFIILCFGKEYLLSNVLLCFLVMNYYTSNIRQTLWTFRESSGIFEKTKHITLVTSAFNFVLSIIFGYFYGITGIVFATVLSRMLYAWWKEPYIIYKDIFKENHLEYYKTYIKRLLLTLGAMYILNFILSFIKFDSIFIQLIIKSIISLTIISALFFAIYKNSIAFKYIKNKFLINLKKGANANG